MGRKSVPDAPRNALLRLRLRDALGESDYDLALFDEDERDDESEHPAAAGGAPASLTIEDLYRINRNKARIAGLLHSHRSFHGAQIIVVTSGDCAAAERERLHDACAWVLPSQADRLPGSADLMPGTMRPAH